MEKKGREGKIREKKGREGKERREGRERKRREGRVELGISSKNIYNGDC